MGPFGSGALRMPLRVWPPLDYFGALLANAVWMGAGAILGRAVLNNDGTLTNANWMSYQDSNGAGTSGSDGVLPWMPAANLTAVGNATSASAVEDINAVHKIANIFWIGCDKIISFMRFYRNHSCMIAIHLVCRVG